MPATTIRSPISLTREQLVEWGERFGRAARAPLVVALAGELGAGKTTLAQAICRGYGVRDQVTSPTFALVHEYAGGPTEVFHLDLYRLKGPRDLTNLAWDDIVNTKALVLIEWPDRAAERVPPEARWFRLSHVAGDDTRRTLTLD